jgi:cyclopropane fatty-acyl-phospholipid synthase-like methyltransferase
VDSLEDARYADLEFNAPLSSSHAGDLIASLQPLAGASIVDLGCGWAEFLLRVLETEPTADGLGVDRDPVSIARARSNAGSRGLLDRVRLECADASAWSEPAEVVIVIGSSHAWGGTRATLNAIRPLLQPGGRLLLGEGIWDRPPTAEALEALDAQPDDFTALAGFVDVCLQCGYRVVARSTASLGEWDSFESRYSAGRERWLLRNPEAPAAGGVRAEIDAHRDGWLRGYRGVLGFAYLTLVVAESDAP